MELHSITSTIVNEAKETAQLIIDDAQNLAKKKIREQEQLAKKEANDKRLVLLKNATNEAALERSNKIANSKITSNWIVLSRKQEIIEAVFEEAKKRLYKLTQTKEYIGILEELIVQAGTILGGKKLDVFLNKKDSKLLLDLNNLSEVISSKTKTDTKLNLSKDKLSVIGGAMLKTNDSKIIMDNTFDDRLRQKENILKFRISEILF